MTEREIVLSAIERSDPESRAAYLDEACAGDAPLRARVEALVRSEVESGSYGGADFTLVPPSNPPATVVSSAGSPNTKALPPSNPSADTLVSARPSPAPRRGEEVGTVIADRYTLVEMIGAGGMGSVYLADQTEPVKRQVALKLIRFGADSKEVLARFDAERQALALMDHPNIARVYDGGTTPAGQPFFVMELVRGVPITAFCDRHRLSVGARLELFVSVCHAVQHAHQKGIIHRDLKPGNILVTEVDGRPAPKVIDFGVAKATELKLTDLSIPDLGAIVGTPAYMSPEQADPSSVDVDTRTDVYALGVVLYELLVGAPPIDGRELKRGTLLEVLRIVREVEPPRPSTKLSTAEGIQLIAANRNTGPTELAKALRGELDWVVMKALEKDRARRYETVDALARDVQRYLADEPVEARPPNRWYKARKFARRNRGPVLAAALVFVALVCGIVGASWGLRRALAAEELAHDRLAQVERAREEAENAFADSKSARAETERALAGSERERERTKSALADSERARGETKNALADSERARAKAETARKQAAAVSDYLVSAFRKPDPATDGRQLKVVDLLDRAAEQLDGDKNMGALTRARLRDALGQTFFSLGLPERAVALQEKALADYQNELGPNDPDTLGVMHRLSFGLGQTPRIDDAIRVGEDLLARRREVLGPDHPDTLLTMTQLAGRYWSAKRLNDAIRLSEQGLAGLRKVWGPEHPELPNAITNLGMLYQDAGRTADAVKLHEEAVALLKTHKGIDHADTVLALNFLGRVYADAGRTADAIALQRDTVARMEEKFGPDHHRTLDAMSKLVQTYYQFGKAPDALPVSTEALKRAKGAKEQNAGAVLTAMHDLAMNYSFLNRPEEALALLQEVVTAATTKLGATHHTTITATHDLGVALRRAGKPAEAIPVLERALAARKAAPAEDDTGLQRTITQLASAYEAVGRATDAVPLLEQLLVVQKAKLDPDHRDLLVTMANLGIAYGSSGRTSDAVRVHEQVVTAFKKKFGPVSPDTQTVIQYLGASYLKDNQLDRAATTYRDLLTATRPLLPADDPDLARTLAGLGEVLLTAQKLPEAETVLRECLKIREKKLPNDWRTFHTKSMLGAVAVGQEQFDAAAPLLIGGYEGLKTRADKIPGSQKALLPGAVDRLIELYTATKRPTEVAKWQAERAKYPPPQAPAPREK